MSNYSEIRYTSTTGVGRPDWSRGGVLIEESDPHCFACRRHTDHFGEHDDLVALGLVTYGEGLDVLVTDLWYTAEGEYLRDLVGHGIDAMVDDAIRQRVCLTKAFGFAQTQAWVERGLVVRRVV
jgi:hypothetical protein